jgi:hypothetical protein
MGDSTNGLSLLLARTAAFGITQRRCLAATPEAALGFVLEAIRTAILPRDLTITVGGVPILRVLASGGRLLRVVDADGMAGTPLDQVADRPLSASNPQDVSEVAKTLLRLFDGQQSLALIARVPETPPDPVEPGIPGDVLLAAVGLVPLATAVPNKLGHFVDVARDALLARWTNGGSLRLEQNAAPLSPRTIERVQRLFDTPPKAVRAVTSGDIVFFCPVDLSEPAIGITRVDGELCALIVQADACADLAAFWADLPHDLTFFTG